MITAAVQLFQGDQMRNNTGECFLLAVMFGESCGNYPQARLTSRSDDTQYFHLFIFRNVSEREMINSVVSDFSDCRLSR